MCSWKRKGDPAGRPDLFCQKCDRCMYTKEDIRSREERGFCPRCSELSASPIGPTDVITIVLHEGS